MMAPYHENDSRTLAVLSTALQSSSKVTRLRAVAMLASVTCGQRHEWLRAALRDSNRGVRETAGIVLSWVCPAEGSACPPRELTAANPVYPGDGDAAERALLGTHGYEWEYAIEVWRRDGLQLGVYFVSTCQEDDHHARSIALGQAILANVGPHGDAFDPEFAATFIVDKGRRPRGPTRA